MDRFTLNPVAFVTTIQPFLFIWVLAISFFLCLTFVALISRGKTWKQLAAAFAVGYVVTTLLVTVGTSAFLDIHVMDVEVVWVPPPGID